MKKLTRMEKSGFYMRLFGLSKMPTVFANPYKISKFLEMGRRVNAQKVLDSGIPVVLELPGARLKKGDEKAHRVEIVTVYLPGEKITMEDKKPLEYLEESHRKGY